MPFSHLPKDFTTPAKSEGFHYSTQLPGTLAIDRLIKGLPAFGLSCVIDGDLRPKTLVLADHLLSHYSPKDFSNVMESLVDLAGLGFQFYSVTAGAVVAFKPNLEMSRFHPVIQGIVPTTPTEIYALMAELGHLGSDVAILDSLSFHNAPFNPNYELLNHLRFNPQLLTQSINHLNNQQLDQQRQSVSITLNDETDFDYWQTLCAHLSTTLFQVKLNSITCYERLQQEPLLQQRIQGLFFNLTEKITDTVSTMASCDHLVALEDLHITGAIENALILQPETLAQLKTLTLTETTYDLRQLAQLLSYTTVLESFHLEKCTHYRHFSEILARAMPLIELDAHPVFTQHFTKLKRIVVVNTSNPVTLLSHLVANSPLLESLTCENAHLITASLRTADLSHLKAVALTCSRADTAPLMPDNALACLQPASAAVDTLENISIIIAASNLTKLTLINCHYSETGVLAHLNLRHLKKLTLSITSINAADFQHILTIATQLETLELSFCDNLQGLSSLPLTQIKKLHLTNLKITAGDFILLLQAMPQLETLVIDNFDAIDAIDPEEYEIPPLKALKNVALTSVNFSAENILALLAHSTQLENLSLDTCQEFSSIDFRTVSLSALTQLTLGGSAIDEESFVRLLSCCPNLQQLRLEENAFISDALNELLDSADFYLEQLVTLSFLDPFSNALLTHFLAMAPNLREFYLGGEFTGPVDLEAGSLAQLTHFELMPELSIDGTTLQCLLKAASELESLVIDNIEVNGPFPYHRLHFNRLKNLSISPLATIYPIARQHMLEHTPQLTEQARRQCQQEMQECLQKMQSGSESTVDSERHGINLNTGLNSGTLTAQTYFKPWSPQAPNILPMHYRLAIYEKCIIEGDELYFVQPTLSYNERPLPQTQDTDNVFCQNVDYYQGKISLLFTSANEKHFLPSIQAKEQLIFLKTEPACPDLQLYYCPETDQYALQANSPMALTVTFGIGVNELIAVSFPELDPLIAQYQAYQPGALAGTTAAEILAQVGVGGIGGACRFRSTAFSQEITVKQCASSIQLRLVNNSLHSYIELSNDAGLSWHPKDLGGNPCATNISTPWGNSLTTLQAEPAPVVPLLVHQTPDAYIQDLLAATARQILLPFSCPADSLAFQAIFHATLSTHIDTLILPVNNPEALTLSTQRLQLSGTDDQAVVANHLTTHNDLLAALSVHADHYRVIYVLIDWSQFTAMQITQYNSLLDATRRLHGVAIPTNVKILSLCTLAQSRDAAFRSRHPDYRPNPCITNDLQQVVATQYPNPVQQGDDSYVIELFNRVDWEPIVQGSLSLGSAGLSFRHGELLKARHVNATTICFSNAPWHVPSFQLFWQNLHRTKTLTVHEQNFRFCGDLQLTQQQGYGNLAQRITAIQWTLEAAPTEAYPLNPYYLGNCLQSHFEQDGVLCTTDGWLVPGTPIHFLVSHALNLDQWLQLIDRIGHLSLDVTFHLAANISLPDALQAVVTIQTATATITSLDPTPHAQLIISSDPVATANRLKATTLPDALIITISGRTSDDWFQSINDIQLTPQGIRVNRVEHDCWRALEAGHSVILQGVFSKEHGHLLSTFFLPTASYFLGQERLTFTGTLVCITNTDTHLSFVPRHQRQAIIETPRAPRHPLDYHEPLDAAIYGNRSTATTDFDHSRLATIKAALDQHAHTPYIVIEGPSDSGKSTFFSNSQTLAILQDILAPCAIYHDIAQLAHWASDHSSQRKLLIVDDIQHSEVNFSLLEDLLNDTPSLFLNGIYYPLTPQHQIIFLSNTQTALASTLPIALFKQHKNQITWRPLAPWYLYARVLAPILRLLVYPDAIQQQIARVLLQQYTTLKNALPVGIQHLKTMAILLVHALLQNVQASGWSTAFYDYQHHQEQPTAARYPHLSAQVQAICQQFTALYLTDVPRPPISNQQVSDRFVLTPSRAPCYQWMNALLATRNLKCVTTNPAIEGDIKVLLIEGLAGIGKSELVEYFIRQSQLVPADCQHFDNRTNTYYEISPASQDIGTLLLKAFNEGAVVIIHEFNSAKLPIRLLKSLLAGKTLENTGPLRAGFMIIADQNPISYHGRQQFSDDFLSNVIKLTLPEYPKQELDVILREKYPALSSVFRSQLINDHCEQRLQAAQNPLLINPTFRELLTPAEIASAAIIPLTLTATTPNHGVKRTARSVTSLNQVDESLVLIIPRAKRPAISS